MSRPGFSFLICPDYELIKQRLAAMLAAQAREDGAEYERRVFWADEGLSPAYVEALTIPDMLGGRKAVVLRRCEVLKDEQWLTVSSHLRGFNSNVWPLFTLEGEWDRGKPKMAARKFEERKFLQVARQRGWVWESPGLTPKTLPAYLRDWAKRHNLSLAPGVLEAMQAVMPLDASALARELEKIALVLGERSTVTQDDLKVVSFEADLQLFDLLRDLASGRNTIGVWRKILSEGGGDDMLFPFLGALAYEVKNLWRFAAGEGDKVRLPPFLKQDKERLARTLGLPRLARIFDLTLEAELSVKTGRVKPDLAMENLAAELGRLFKTR